jgi:integrase
MASATHLITDHFITRKLPGLMVDKQERYFRDSRLQGFMVRGRRRKDDSVAVSYFITWFDGKGEPKMVIGDSATFTADEAREDARKRLQSLANGSNPKAERDEQLAQPTFDDLLNDYREGELSEKEESTRKSYEARIRRILMPAFKGKKLAEITPAAIDALRRKHRSRKTDLNRAFATGSRMMTLAVRKGWIAVNPFKGAERFEETPRDHWLDELDLPVFLENLGKQEGATAELVRFLCVTGWRISKARLLRWDQVDLKRLTVNLQETETKKSATVLSADAAALVDRQSHRIGFVFSKTSGRKPVDYKAVLRILQDVCKAADIKPITPHVLRHTAASWAAINGATAYELQKGFGWKTLTMTSRYVSRSETLARSGAEKAARGINIFAKPKAEVIDLK